MSIHMTGFFLKSDSSKKVVNGSVISPTAVGNDEAKVRIDLAISIDFYGPTKTLDT